MSSFVQDAEDKRNEKDESGRMQLVLLRDVCGAFRPGVLTCLMGASGMVPCLGDWLAGQHLWHRFSVELHETLMTNKDDAQLHEHASMRCLQSGTGIAELGALAKISLPKLLLARNGSLPKHRGCSRVNACQKLLTQRLATFRCWKDHAYGLLVWQEDKCALSINS